MKPDPCPFCPEVNVRLAHQAGGWVVVCERCAAEGPIAFEDEHHADPGAVAVQRWNARRLAPRPVDQERRDRYVCAALTGMLAHPDFSDISGMAIEEVIAYADDALGAADRTANKDATP